MNESRCIFLLKNGEFSDVMLCFAGIYFINKFEADYVFNAGLDLTFLRVCIRVPSKKGVVATLLGLPSQKTRQHYSYAVTLDFSMTTFSVPCCGLEPRFRAAKFFSLPRNASFFDRKGSENHGLKSALVGGYVSSHEGSCKVVRQRKGKLSLCEFFGLGLGIFFNWQTWHDLFATR